MDKCFARKPKETFHDFMTDRKWLVNVMGFGESRSLHYIIYVIALLVFFIYVVSMAIYGLIMVFPDKNLVIAALHVVMNSVFTVWGLATRLITDKALQNVRHLIKTGFYSYQGEELHEEQIKMKEDSSDEVRRRSTDFIYIGAVGGFANVLFFPISQVMTVTDEEYESIADIANPYLPAFFFMPFSTRRPLGLIVALILSLLFFFYIVGAAIIMNEIYLSCAIQLRVQLRILNYSIRNIHKRAYMMHAKMNNVRLKDISLNGVFEDRHYQKCVYRCLRSNIEHHQLLMRFNKEVLKFSGSFLLLMVFIASITFASDLFIILQHPPLNEFIKCLATLFVEQAYTLYLCVFGEMTMQEVCIFQSACLLESLYSIPWFYYEKKVNQNLQIFMGFTRKPMRVKSLLLDFTASLETYAQFLTSMYKIVNILKQSDTI